MKRHYKDALNVKRLAPLCAGLVAAGVFLLPTSATAQVYTMSNGGSTATINVGNTGVLGMNSWTVGGVSGSQLNQQWFWYSVNGAPQQPINTISAASVANFSNPLSPIDNLGIQYQNSQLTVQVTYILSGNGANSASADMMENLSIVNNGASSINLEFYQYSNFNLFQNNNNSVSIFGSPGAYTGASQTANGAGGSSGIAEVIEAPLANYAEAGFVPTTLNELNSGSYYTLNDNTSAANGDVTWAFQWEALNLASGDTLNITKDKGLSITLAPEPSSLAFIVLGIGALGMSLRRK